MAATPQDVQTKIAGAEKLLTQTTKSWPQMVKSYGADWTRWPTSTLWWQAFTMLNAAAMEAGQLVAPASPPPQVSGSGTWSVAVPQSPITDITNLTGLGLNVYQAPGGSYHDYTSDGTFDSAVLVQPLAPGSTFARFHLVQAASVGAGPGYGRHGIYAKAKNVTCTDWYVRMDPAAPDVGSCFSARMAGFNATRFDADGLFVASIYNDDPTPGTITFADGVGVGHHPDTCVWVDTPVAHHVVFQGCDFKGPGLFVRANLSAPLAATFEFDSCTMAKPDGSGKHALTLADTNIPASLATIQQT